MMDIRIILFSFLLAIVEVMYGAEEPFGTNKKESLPLFLMSHCHESQKIIALLDKSDYASLARTCKSLSAYVSSLLRREMLVYWSSKSITSSELAGHLEDVHRNFEFNDCFVRDHSEKVCTSGLISSLSFSPDGKLLASGSYAETVRLWDVATETLYKLLSPLHRYSGSVHIVQFAPDSSMLASVQGFPDADTTIMLWPMHEKSVWQKRRENLLHAVAKGQFEIIEKYYDIRSVSFCPTGKFLAIDDCVHIALWDLSLGKEKKEIFDSVRLEEIAFSNDGKMLFCLGWEIFQYKPAWLTGLKWYIKSANLKTGKIEKVWLKHRVEAPMRISAAQFSPNRMFLAVSEYNYEGPLLLSGIVVRDVKTGNEIRSFANIPCNALAFSPCGNILVAGFSQGYIILWDVNTGAEINRFYVSEAVTALSFSRNGKILASGEKSGIVRMWKLRKKTA